MWVFALLTYVSAQSAVPLLPDGVTIDMVQQIQVSTQGTVQFLQSSDGSSTIAARLKMPSVSFDKATGILHVVDTTQLSESTIVKPGLMAAFLGLGFFAYTSKTHSLWLALFTLGLGLASAQSFVAADITIRVPGCWHTEGDGGKTLIFDQSCTDGNSTVFVAAANPSGTTERSLGWQSRGPGFTTPPGHASNPGTQLLDPNDEYEVWRAEAGKSYNATSKKNFLNFTNACRQHNKNPNRTWTAAVNQFSELSYEDWVSIILADNAQIYAAAGATGRRLLGEETLYSDISHSQRRKLLQTTNFTWLGKGVLTPVKDQGQCGSCYAHSTTSQMEAHLAIVTKTPPTMLSREQLKDCSTGSPGCGGGLPSNMYTYAAATHGLTSEATYPYVAVNAGCRAPTPSSIFKDAGYNSIANNENAFKTALNTAPIAITVCSSTWGNYAGGVFTNCVKGCAIDHAVLLVGYGRDPTYGDYWLIQNSWNTWWGESGFIRLPNTHSSTAGVGMCGMTTRVGYQTKTPAKTTTTVDCKGSWSAWSACTKTCGGGTQTATWTTTQQPGTGGVACPSPTTQTQSCNTQLCPQPSLSSTTCLHLTNTILGSNGDGDYGKSANWQQNWCGTTTNPQYTHINSAGQTIVLFFYATNCLNNAKTAGLWGVGTTAHAAYQWSGSVAVTSGVIPGPFQATGANWTMTYSVGTTC